MLTTPTANKKADVKNLLFYLKRKIIHFTRFQYLQRAAYLDIPIIQLQLKIESEGENITISITIYQAIIGNNSLQSTTIEIIQQQLATTTGKSSE